MLQNNLVDRIAAGTATLLGIDDICKRLGISRTTFDRWVRNGGGKSDRATIASILASKMLNDASKMLNEPLGAITRIAYQAENSTEGAITFPPPDIRIGNSPKWELETFKQWLRENVKDGNA